MMTWPSEPELKLIIIVVLPNTIHWNEHAPWPSSSEDGIPKPEGPAPRTPHVYAHSITRDDLKHDGILHALWGLQHS